MSFYCIVSQHNEEVFNSYLLPYLQKWEVATAVSMDSIPGKTESIFIKYNDAIKKLIENKETPLKDADIVCFCHEDVKLIDPFFVPKIELVFSEREDVGLCGVVGTAVLGDGGAWWHNNSDNLRGHVMQENGTSAEHLIKGKVGYFDDLVAIDGLCFFIRGSLLIDGLRFDNDTYDGFHFYDIDTCISVLERGFKIACADILVQHKSIGDVSKNKSWYDSRDKFVSKWKARGLQFPIDQKVFIDDNIKAIEV
jgi:hypothetical protein